MVRIRSPGEHREGGKIWVSGLRFKVWLVGLPHNFYKWETVSDGFIEKVNTRVGGREKVVGNSN